jgi:bifunctional non-homologous end joining protein LigD
MPLDEYRRKRNFKQTPEPPPERPTTVRNKQLSYCIQKHAATRLHYDFRLEHDGVLLSWAVTRGPSLNPADKRLAVRTEDHPLSYGNFEGTIPKDQYGGGTVMLWDRGTWEPTYDPHAGLKKGHLAFTLKGERLRGSWDLVRMHGARNNDKHENWLLIKSKDNEACTEPSGEQFLEDLSTSVKTGRTMEAIARGEKPVSTTKKRSSPRDAEALRELLRKYPGVHLATLVAQPPEGKQWLHEVKYDGYRLLGFLAGSEVALRTRNGLDWTDKFPSIADSIRKLKAKDAVVDMEAVIPDASGKTSFQRLQGALSDAGNAKRIMAYVFDLLHCDAQRLTELTIIERKAKLKVLLQDSGPGKALNFSEHVVGQGKEIYEKSCALGLEGVVSKLADGPYVIGRGRSWLKSKCTKSQEFIVLGYSNARSGGRALGAVYLGYYKDGKLSYAGKVGTGFTMRGARELTLRVEPLAASKPVLSRADMRDVGAAEWKSIHWVKPQLLCEVSFTEWTSDGSIRHPSFKGLREDKKASEVGREKEKEVKRTPGPKKSVPNGSASANGLVLHGVAITHPDRVISEEGHVTKGELAEYYAAAAPYLLRRIRRHPLSILRCPGGIDGECFYQRNPHKVLGGNVHPYKFRHKGKVYNYFYIEDEKGLMELVQMGTVEIHPWGATIDAIDYPDRMIFDLDPAPDVPFEAVKLAAQDLRKRLEKMQLKTLPVCTGGKGLHVIVPMAGKDKWPDVKSFAGDVAMEMVNSAPTVYVATMTKAKRTNKIFIDFFRNDYTATATTEFGVRARPGLPVAVPLNWKDLDSLESANQFHMPDVLKRFKTRKPPYWPEAHTLP